MYLKKMKVPKWQFLSGIYAFGINNAIFGDTYKII